MRVQIEVVAWRGDVPESTHAVQAAVCDADGRVHASSADPDLVTTFRSAAKPFQLLPLVERGHADRWGFGDEELALMAASHRGSARHVEVVERILTRVGLPAGAMACAYHEPADPASREMLQAHPERRSTLYNNCSGKHAGMLCLARSEGWPIDGYERAEHPLQRLMRETVASVAGLAPETLTTGVDGCSIVTFGLPLTGMARAYARLAAARPGGDARDQALARIRLAMSDHPRAIAGEGALDTRLMEASRGTLVSKGGAEALVCVGLPARGLGLALKVVDGSARAVGPAVIALLDQLGALDEKARAALEPLARPVVTNHAGLEVGVLEARVRTLAEKA